MPYCADQDLKNLLYQAASVYQDMNTYETQRITLKNIQVMRKRCLALSHWFETVIKMFIPLMTQYSIVSAQYDQKKEQLKLERIELLNSMIQEAGGKMIDVNVLTMPVEIMKQGANDFNLSELNFDKIINGVDKTDKNTSKKKVTSRDKEQGAQDQPKGIDNTKVISKTIVPLEGETVKNESVILSKSN